MSPRLACRVACGKRCSSSRSCYLLGPDCLKQSLAVPYGCQRMGVTATESSNSIPTPLSLAHTIFLLLRLLLRGTKDGMAPDGGIRNMACCLRRPTMQLRVSRDLLRCNVAETSSASSNLGVGTSRFNDHHHTDSISIQKPMADLMSLDVTDCFRCLVRVEFEGLRNFANPN